MVFQMVTLQGVDGKRYFINPDHVESLCAVVGKDRQTLVTLASGREIIAADSDMAIFVTLRSGRVS